MIQIHAFQFYPFADPNLANNIRTDEIISAQIKFGPTIKQYFDIVSYEVSIDDETEILSCFCRHFSPFPSFPLPLRQRGKE